MAASGVGKSAAAAAAGAALAASDDKQKKKTTPATSPASVNGSDKTKKKKDSLKPLVTNEEQPGYVYFAVVLFLYLFFFIVFLFLLAVALCCARVVYPIWLQHVTMLLQPSLAAAAKQKIHLPDFVLFIYPFRASASERSIQGREAKAVHSPPIVLPTTWVRSAGGVHRNRQGISSCKLHHLRVQAAQPVCIRSKTESPQPTPTPKMDRIALDKGSCR